MRRVIVLTALTLILEVRSAHADRPRLPEPPPKPQSAKKGDGDLTVRVQHPGGAEGSGTGQWRWITALAGAGLGSHLVGRLLRRVRPVALAVAAGFVLGGALGVGVGLLFAWVIVPEGAFSIASVFIGAMLGFLGALVGATSALSGGRTEITLG